MNIKLNIHPEAGNEKSQYVRLYLEEFLVENGIPSHRIIWRSPYIISFRNPVGLSITQEEWIDLINKRFDMNLCSAFIMESAVA